MNIRTIESDFEYQANNIFEAMAQDYKEEMHQRKINNRELISFADWLWDNKEDLGEAFYNQFDQYAGIDETTERFNFI